MSFKEVKQLREEGRLTEARTMAENDYSTDQSHWPRVSLLWTCYDQCKVAAASNDRNGVDDAYGRVLQLAQSCANVEDEAQAVGWTLREAMRHYLDVGDTLAVRRALMQYLHLPISRPSLLHSCILRVAVSLEDRFKEVFKFTKFLKLWGMENFSEDDWVEQENNGKRFFSLVGKAIIKYAAELKDDNIHDHQPEFISLLTRAIKTYPHRELFVYYYAKQLAREGDTSGAREAYKQLAMKSGQSYVWKDLAALTTTPRLKTAMLCRAIMTQRDEKMLGRLRLDLAEQFVSMNLMEAAKYELALFNRAKNGRSQDLPGDYYILRSRIPEETVMAVDNRQLYQQLTEELDMYLYPDAKSVYAVFEQMKNTNFGKKKAILIDQNGNTHQINASKLSCNCHFYRLLIANVDNRMKVISVSVVNDELAQNAFIRVEGPVSLHKNEKGTYGFVNRCYVHSRMLRGIQQGEPMSLLAVKDEKGRLRAIMTLKR